jgi:glyoxylase-like metal-dependent hydrolase (beta-lactamase superfamily II)
MTALAPGLDFVDLRFLGSPEVIATAVLQGAGGVALVDPGPSTTLETLLAGLRAKGIAPGDIRQILLTHIHLDHAGATGGLLRMAPEIEVFVHAAGAPHMVDPGRLLASATRLYGADMERLWGEVLPVPADRIRILEGGERLQAGGRDLEVAYTPGHAVHHVSYLDKGAGVAFVGDTAGIRRGSCSYVLPPLPPPDIDLEAWRASADRLLAWDPDTLFLTHFGPFHGARPHLQELFARIAAWSRTARRLLADATLDDEGREARFVEEAALDLRRHVGDEAAAHYMRAGRLEYSWLGLARYWRKRLGQSGRPPSPAK